MHPLRPAGAVLRSTFPAALAALALAGAGCARTDLGAPCHLQDVNGGELRPQPGREYLYLGSSECESFACLATLDIRSQAAEIGRGLINPLQNTCRGPAGILLRGSRQLQEAAERAKSSDNKERNESFQANPRRRKDGPAVSNQFNPST